MSEQMIIDQKIEQIIRTVLCHVEWRSFAQSQAHLYEQFLQVNQGQLVYA